MYYVADMLNKSPESSGTIPSISISPYQVQDIIDREFSIIPQLLERVMFLNSFDGVSAWDAQAREQVTKINEVLGLEIPQKVEAVNANISIYEAEIKKSRFSKNASLAFKKKKEAYFDINLYEALSYRLVELRTELIHWIDTTPDSKEEAKQMIAELKLAQKELSAQKKELSISIRKQNQFARRKNVIIAGEFFSSPKLRQWQRYQVRVDRYNAVASLEDEIAEIETQSLEMDRLIIWIERILA